MGTISKETIDPIRPRDIDNLKSEAYSSSQFDVGDLVVRTGDRTVEPCDLTHTGSEPDIIESELSTKSHVFRPAEIVWTDSKTRFDATRYNSEGKKEYQVTTIPFPFVADVDKSIINVFDGGSTYSSVSSGDALIKSFNAKREIQVISPGDIDAQFDDHDANVGSPTTALPSSFFDGIRIGYVVDDNASSDNMIRCQFQLR